MRHEICPARTPSLCSSTLQALDTPPPLFSGKGNEVKPFPISSPKYFSSFPQHSPFPLVRVIPCEVNPNARGPPPRKRRTRTLSVFAGMRPPLTLCLPPLAILFFPIMVVVSLCCCELLPGVQTPLPAKGSLFKERSRLVYSLIINLFYRALETDPVHRRLSFPGRTKIASTRERAPLSSLCFPFL